MFARLAALPGQAHPMQRAQLLAALSVEIAIVQLRRAADELGMSSDLQPALSAFAHGRSAMALGELVRLDRQLAGLAADPQSSRVATRARGQILVISDAVAQHRDYFDSGV
jgi:hypothetical protein